MERSWDYIVKEPTGMVLTIAAAVLLTAFIVAGGIFMRMEMQHQRNRLKKAHADSAEATESEKE